MTNKSDHGETITIIVFIIIFLIGLREMDKSTEVKKDGSSESAAIHKTLIDARYGDQIDQDMWYLENQVAIDCWDACDGFDDPDCEVCAELSK